MFIPIAHSLGAKTRYSGGKPPCPMCHRCGWVWEMRERALREWTVGTHVDDQHALYAFLLLQIASISPWQI